MIADIWRIMASPAEAIERWHAQIVVDAVHPCNRNRLRVEYSLSPLDGRPFFIPRADPRVVQFEHFTCKSGALWVAAKRIVDPGEECAQRILHPARSARRTIGAQITNALNLTLGREQTALKCDNCSNLLRSQRCFALGVAGGGVHRLALQAGLTAIPHDSVDKAEISARQRAAV